MSTRNVTGYDRLSDATADRRDRYAAAFGGGSATIGERLREGDHVAGVLGEVVAVAQDLGRGMVVERRVHALEPGLDRRGVGSCVESIGAGADIAAGVVGDETLGGAVRLCSQRDRTASGDDLMPEKR